MARRFICDRKIDLTPRIADVRCKTLSCTYVTDQTVFKTLLTLTVFTVTAPIFNRFSRLSSVKISTHRGDHYTGKIVSNGQKLSLLDLGEVKVYFFDKLTWQKNKLNAEMEHLLKN